MNNSMRAYSEEERFQEREPPPREEEKQEQEQDPGIEAYATEGASDSGGENYQEGRYSRASSDIGKSLHQNNRKRSVENSGEYIHSRANPSYRPPSSERVYNWRAKSQDRRRPRSHGAPVRERYEEGPERVREYQDGPDRVRVRYRDPQANIRMGPLDLAVDFGEDDYYSDEFTYVRAILLIAKLRHRMEKLQNEFSEIESICAPDRTPGVHFVPAEPNNLTFRKIAEEVKGYSLQLQMWESAAGVRDLHRIDDNGQLVLKRTARVLARLLDRARDLKEACSDAGREDLKIGHLPVLPNAGLDNIDYDIEEDDNGTDVTESIGFFITCQLRSMRINMKSLSALLIPLQKLSPAYRSERDALSRLVERLLAEG